MRDDEAADLTFRRLRDDDLPTMHAWLNDPGVIRWWEGDDVSWAGVQATYGSASTDPVEHWIVSLRGHEVGWLQCYALAAFADEARAWFAEGVELTAAGIDYLVGDPSQRGHGLGSAMIRAFVRDVVFGRHPAWTQVAAAPMAANAASWRALQRAGFSLRAVLDEPDGPCRLMVCDRPPDESAA